MIANVQAGLSGPAIKPIALLKVHQVYQEAWRHMVPIIGQGGIASATDAIEFLIAGASAIGIGTALFYDPLICRSVNAGIADYLDVDVTLVRALWLALSIVPGAVIGGIVAYALARMVSG